MTTSILPGKKRNGTMLKREDCEFCGKYNKILFKNKELEICLQDEEWKLLKGKTELECKDVIEKDIILEKKDLKMLTKDEIKEYFTKRCRYSKDDNIRVIRNLTGYEENYILGIYAYWKKEYMKNKYI